MERKDEEWIYKDKVGLKKKNYTRATVNGDNHFFANFLLVLKRKSIVTQNTIFGRIENLTLITPITQLSPEVMRIFHSIMN